MVLYELEQFQDRTNKTMFSGLKVRTANGVEGYLHFITKNRAVLTEEKCSPESYCTPINIVGDDFKQINQWEILEVDSKPVSQYEHELKGLN